MRGPLRALVALLAAARIGSSSAITGFTTTTVAVGGAVAAGTLTSLVATNYVCFTAATNTPAVAATCAAAGVVTDVTATAGGCSAVGAAVLTASTSTNLHVSVIECTVATAPVGSAVAGTLAYIAAVATGYTSGSPLTAGTAGDVVIATTGLGASTTTAGLFLKIVEGSCGAPTKTIAAGAAVTATSTTEGTVSINAAVGMTPAAGRVCTSATEGGTYADLGTPKTDFAVNAVDCFTTPNQPLATCQRWIACRNSGGNSCDDGMAASVTRRCASSSVATVCIHAAAHPSPTRAPLTRTPSPRAGVSLLFALWLQRRSMKSKQVIGTIPAADLAKMTALGSLCVVLRASLPSKRRRPLLRNTACTLFVFPARFVASPRPFPSHSPPSTAALSLDALAPRRYSRHLSNNLLTGPLPTEVGLLTALTTKLYVYH